MTQNSSPDPGSLRVGDTDREDAAHRLGEHLIAGRLTADEHSERTTAAYAARTQHDLDALFVDLPGEPHPGPTNRAADRDEGDDTYQRPCGPPWMRTGAARGRASMPCWPPLLLVFVLVSGLGAVAHGRPPVALLALVIVAVVASTRGRGGRRRHHRHHPHR